ncbi:hypothetical protein HNR42_003410 [Deinobacterium chartae]|uniref:Arginase n=1 Tax=Deinobacterium chartae TaxID=521158 RepID=A0A841I6A4_9DEIO|nr:hypothetical protein [Deinobacterium chartae]
MRLLSVDWDYYAGSAEQVFDSPLWGSPDRDYHRVARWADLLARRGGDPRALQADFPLHGDPRELLRYRGLPVHAALSHDAAWAWLAGYGEHLEVINLDSHHDLYSSSGDPARLRPGNWAGLALAAGRVARYTCVYPEWHARVRVAEGFDLERTEQEIRAAVQAPWRERVSLERGTPLPGDVAGVLIVQSPAWSNPQYDGVLLELLSALEARTLTEAPLDRRRLLPQL